MKTIVMSLGGSLIAPDGLDIKFLKNFKKLILAYTRKGNQGNINLRRRKYLPQL